MENIQMIPTNPAGNGLMQKQTAGAADSKAENGFLGLMMQLSPKQGISGNGKLPGGKMSLEELQQLAAMQLMNWGVLPMDVSHAGHVENLQTILKEAAENGLSAQKIMQMISENNGPSITEEVQEMIGQAAAAHGNGRVQGMEEAGTLYDTDVINNPLSSEKMRNYTAEIFQNKNSLNRFPGASQAEKMADAQSAEDFRSAAGFKMPQNAVNEKSESTAMLNGENLQKTAVSQSSVANSEMTQSDKMQILSSDTADPNAAQEKKDNWEAPGEAEPVFRDLETIPVKVSETGKSESAKADTAVEHQVLDKLKEAVSNGMKKLEIQLNPHNLGKIRVELMQKEDGTLQISLHAEKTEIRTLLERSIPEMQQLLRNENQPNVQVQVPEPKQNQFYEGERQQQHQQQNPQENSRQSENSQDFLNRLRLGLAPLDEEAS